MLIENIGVTHNFESGIKHQKKSKSHNFESGPTKDHFSLNF
jgi:hypothetical protein